MAGHEFVYGACNWLFAGFFWGLFWKAWIGLCLIVSALLAALSIVMCIISNRLLREIWRTTPHILLFNSRSVTLYLEGILKAFVKTLMSIFCITPITNCNLIGLFYFSQFKIRPRFLVFCFLAFCFSVLNQSFNTRFLPTAWVTCLLVFSKVYYLVPLRWFM